MPKSIPNNNKHNFESLYYKTGYKDRLPSEDSTKRLPFIKYLYNLALHQSTQPKPFDAASILTFHDSVELFLQLACEELDIEADKGTRFMDYWGILKGKLPNGKSLEHKSQMNRLNTVRVGLKHHGIMHDKSEIEKSRFNVTNFFEEYTSLIFNTSFDKVSMVDLVLYIPAREKLKKATFLKGQGNYGEALGNIAIAFEQIIDDYEIRKESTYRKSPFSFELSNPHSIRYRKTDENTKQFVINSIEPLRKAMKIIGLGLDFKRYVKFKLMVPDVIRFMAKEGDYQFTATNSSQKRTKEDYQFCYDFVIDCALKIRDFDFDIEKP